MNYLKKGFYLLLLVGSTISCGNNDTVEAEVLEVKIGDIKEGGVVFWVNPADKTKGLVCAFSNYANNLNNLGWGCFGTDLPDVPSVPDNGTIPAGLGAEIGDGKSNTDSMLKDCPDSFAALGSRLLGAEWYLPSAKELNEMYSNKAVLEAVVGFTPLSDYSWSSTEINDLYAWAYFDGSIKAKYKDLRFTGRAIRAF
jgi:hypothetical protein